MTDLNNILKFIDEYKPLIKFFVPDDKQVEFNEMAEQLRADKKVRDFSDLLDQTIADAELFDSYLDRTDFKLEYIRLHFGEIFGWTTKWHLFDDHFQLFNLHKSITFQLKETTLTKWVDDVRFWFKDSNHTVEYSRYSIENIKIELWQCINKPGEQFKFNGTLDELIDFNIQFKIKNKIK